MKLMYVGLKVDGESAFSDKTGIVWMPGSSHEVSDAHAALMLPHTDVWAIAEEAPADEPESIPDALTGLVNAKRKPGRPRKDA